MAIQPQLRKSYASPISIKSQGTMDSDEMSMELEPLSMDLWSSPSLKISRKIMPNTINEIDIPFCISEDYSSLPTWDSSKIPFQSLHKNHSQTYSVPHDYFMGTYSGETKSLLSNGDQKQTESNADISSVRWNSKSYDEGIDLQNFDSEMNLITETQEYTTDECPLVMGIRYPESGMKTDQFGARGLYNNNNKNDRRMSGSSFTMSSIGQPLDMQSYDEFSTSFSESTTFSSDQLAHSSNRNSLMSSSQLSPVASPRMIPQNQSDISWSQNKSRASPSSRSSRLSTKYNADSNLNKRWSTGSYALTSNRRPSPFIYQKSREIPTSNVNLISSRHSSPTLPNEQQLFNTSDFHQTQPHPLSIPDNNNYQPENSDYQPNNIFVPSQTCDDVPFFENQPPTISHSLFRMLQSNADTHSLHSNCTDFCEQPDLYASLREDYMPPPPEDMNPSNPDLIPHEQELRFEGDLYTPRWVRGHGNKREGWCGICKPGRWLILKNSAFWYDKSFTHGISAATGSPFKEPQKTRRMGGNPDVWEGFCGSCNDWVALVSSKKKGTTWFRHAYKCHTHAKVKDAPKRRRESLYIRAVGASKVVKSKTESPRTPQKSNGGSISLIHGLSLGLDPYSPTNQQFFELNNNRQIFSQVEVKNEI
ncbi:hypothetical protein GcC1_204011 [Golovinomyces cichoracearum]|uniref:Transcription regulator Rua1 C-terminal domain-containing protein n=1 Tax=Golovinomyces cichoracearum TaxID=62708 RepID=A0A420HD85_9PEZI|nr:hypothetical protein GcC1_204011 [Golovinomyces cichoracearum]